MARDTTTELQKNENPGVPTVPEQTRSGPIYTPAVDIFEDDHRITVLADMPGVKAEDLKIDLRENVLTLSGNMASPEAHNESDVLREYHSGLYFRQFTLAESIDQAKIDAQLKDGVVRVELPKVERAKPRQIAVRTG